MGDRCRPPAACDGHPLSAPLPAPTDIAAEFWRRGDLRYKLHAGQSEIDAWFDLLEATIAFLHCARGWGKTWWLLCRAFRKGLATPGFRGVYAAPTREQAKQIVIPTGDLIIADAPKEFKPVWMGSDHCYYLPSTDGRLIVDGADDDHGNHLRGPFAHEGYCDELGFWRDPVYVTKSVLLPQVQRRGGRLIGASTSPESVGHPFVGMCAQAQSAGAYVKRTIYQNPMKSPAQIEREIFEMGGEERENSTAVRRELLCEFVTETTRQVTPEFSRARNIWDDTTFTERPMFSDLLLGMDLGHVDLTHVLFAWYHFESATLYVEDEWVSQYARTPQVAAGVKAKEAALWGDRKVHLRVSDNELQQIADLGGEGLHFVPAIKTDKEAALNAMRSKLATGKIKVHVRCVRLLAMLEQGIWNKARSDYERIDGLGHLDGIDALVYLCRTMDWKRNPVPAGYGQRSDTHWQNPAAVKRNGLQKMWGR